LKIVADRTRYTYYFGKKTRSRKFDFWETNLSYSTTLSNMSIIKNNKGITVYIKYIEYFSKRY